MRVAHSHLLAPATKMAALLRGCKPTTQTNFVNTDSVMGFPRSRSFCRHTTLLGALRGDPKLERLREMSVLQGWRLCKVWYL